MFAVMIAARTDDPETTHLVGGTFETFIDSLQYCAFLTLKKKDCYVQIGFVGWKQSE